MWQRCHTIRYTVITRYGAVCVYLTRVKCHGREKCQGCKIDVGRTEYFVYERLYRTKNCLLYKQYAEQVLQPPSLRSCVLPRIGKRTLRSQLTRPTVLPPVG